MNAMEKLINSIKQNVIHRVGDFTFYQLDVDFVDAAAAELAALLMAAREVVDAYHNTPASYSLSRIEASMDALAALLPEETETAATPCVHGDEVINIINQAERKIMLAGEMGKAICNLANIVEDWNDAQEEPDERGRGNGAIGLIVFEDGSGCITDFQYPIDKDPLSNGAVINQFKSPEEAQDWFMDNISGRSLI